MPIEGEVDEAELRFRQQLGTGKIDGEEVKISINADGRALFIELDEERIMYDMDEMVQDAYREAEGEQAKALVSRNELMEVLYLLGEVTGKLAARESDDIEISSRVESAVTKLRNAHPDVEADETEETDEHD